MSREKHWEAIYRLLDSMREDYRTPSGLMQAFVYCLCRLEGGQK